MPMNKNDKKYVWFKRKLKNYPGRNKWTIEQMQSDVVVY